MQIPQFKTKFYFEFKQYFHPVYRKNVYRKDDMGDVVVNESVVCDNIEQAHNILKNGYKWYRPDRAELIKTETIELYGQVNSAMHQPELPINEEYEDNYDEMD